MTDEMMSLRALMEKVCPADRKQAQIATNAVSPAVAIGRGATSDIAEKGPSFLISRKTGPIRAMSPPDS